MPGAVLHLIITIDGPAGSGKSTAARSVADRLGILHLNAGLLYRAVAWKALQHGIELGDESSLAPLAEGIAFAVGRGHAGRMEILVDGAQPPAELWSEAIGEAASRIAVLRRVREVLTEVQRQFGAKESLVLEGRDAGTVVFPDAPSKFYLDASPEARARRRCQDQAHLPDVLRELEVRDRRDAERKHSPHRIPEGAIIIDTTEISADEVAEKIVSHLSREG